MASFKTHITFGIALGILSPIVLSILALGSGTDFFLALLVLAILGSILPDIDSDSGIPFHLTFGTLSLLSAVFVFFFLFYEDGNTFVKSVLWAILALLGVWGLLGGLFKKCTKHRGMAHSIPIAVLFTLITFFLMSRYSFGDVEALLLGCILGLGYCIHLVLDEVYSLVDFHGKKLSPKQSLGSSLKFFSHSKWINMVVYGGIVILLYPNWELFREMIERILADIR